MFNWFAEKKHWEKRLIAIGYLAGIIQYIALYLVRIINSEPIIILFISFICNLFIVAYIPAIKAYFSHLSTDKKGSILSKLNIIHTLAFGCGMLLGGISYDVLKLQTMILISFIFSIIALFLLIFISTFKISSDINTQSEEKIQIMKNNQINANSHLKSIFSFKSALIYQFFLLVFAAMFFGLFSAFLQDLGALSWFYGSIYAIDALFGVITFRLFGKILDKYGPDSLFAFGWITYTVVYLGLLSGNIIIIFVVWTLPAFTFHISTEFSASRQSNKKKVIRNMALATFTQTLGTALGIILGGIIAIFSPFQIVMLVSLIGNLIMGAIYTLLLLIKHFKV